MQAIIDSQREGSQKIELENQWGAPYYHPGSWLLILVDRSLRQQVLQLQSELKGLKAGTEPATVSKKAEEMLRMKIESERTLQERVRALGAEAEKLRRVNRDLDDELLDLRAKVDEQIVARPAAATTSVF